MSHESWVLLIAGTVISSVLAVLGFIASKLWGYIDDLKDETHRNTIAIVELTVQLRLTASQLTSVPKLERDVNNIWAWKRSLDGDEGET